MSVKLLSGDIQNYPQLGKFRPYLRGHEGFIAGGAFKNLFLDEPVKDIDVFFENEEAFEVASKFYSKRHKLRYENEKVRAFVHDATGVVVELNHHRYGGYSEIVKSFDFTVTKFAYGRDDEGEAFVAFHPQFFEHLHLRRLVIDEGMQKPLNTFVRALRYAGYGYRLCSESKLKLVTEIKAAEIDGKDLFGSIYDGID